MASVHNDEENRFLLRLMSRQNQSLTWLGAVFYNGHFTWLDNSYVNYLNWAPGQPDVHEWGECIGLGQNLHDWAGQPGAWDDVDCRDFPATSCACMRPED